MHFVLGHGMTRRNIGIQRESKLHTCPCVGGWQNKRGEFSMQKRCRVICRLKHENLIMIIMLYSSCNGNGLSSLFVFFTFFHLYFRPRWLWKGNPFFSLLHRIEKKHQKMNVLFTSQVLYMLYRHNNPIVHKYFTVFYFIILTILLWVVQREMRLIWCLCVFSLKLEIKVFFL